MTGHSSMLVLVVAVLLTSVACSQPQAAQAVPPTPRPAQPAVAGTIITTPPADSGTPGLIPGSERLTLDPAVNQARYRAREMLLGRTSFSEAIGVTQASGTILVSPSHSIISSGSLITIDLTQLKSDEPERDAFIKEHTLEVDRFPEATFVPRAIQNLPDKLPDTHSVGFQISGDLTVHGVTRTTSFNVAADVEADAITGSASAVIKLQDFGMDPPSVPVVLSIDDNISLEIIFNATRETIRPNTPVPGN